LEKKGGKKVKHSIGDRVTVRIDLVGDGTTIYKMHGVSHGVYANNEMVKLAGKEVIISWGESDYSIKEDGGLWFWTDEMFEDTNEYEISFEDKLNQEFEDYCRWHCPVKEHEIYSDEVELQCEECNSHQTESVYIELPACETCQVENFIRRIRDLDKEK